MGGDPIDRRVFIRAAAVTAGAVAIGGAGSLLVGRAGAKRHGKYRVPSWEGRNLLEIPPAVALGSLASPYQLTAKTSTVPIGGGTNANIWSYSDLMPGPTLLARRGESVQIEVLNQLTQPHITHWHGMVVDFPNDGHPRSEVASGSSYSYSFPVNQRATLNWYHPHTDMLTGQQVAMGMAGGFLVRDDEEDALGLPSGSREVPLVIRDASLDNSNNMQFSAAAKGFFGTFPLVNGTRDPYLRVEPAWYRFRILGGTNARIWELKLSTGAPFTLIGNDGGLLTSPTQVSQITVAPGERVDVLVDFRGLAKGTQIMLQDVTTGWNLLGFLIAYVGSDTFTVPSTLSTITPLANPVRTRTFSFDGMNAINGSSYDVSRVDFQVPFGETELWRFSTGGNGPHPVHVHGASFQVQSRTGGRGQLYPWEAGWKDTVLLQDGETIDVLVRFEGYRSLYLLHCHQLGHEDNGMMMNFEVV